MGKRQDSVRRGRMRLSVIRKSSGWVIEGSPGTAPSVYKTQRDAIAAARKLINAYEGGEVVLHGRDGQIREVDTYVVGGDGFDKISAVEGIFLSGEMKRDFDTLDRKRLSHRERRKWLIQKYGCGCDELRRRK